MTTIARIAALSLLGILAGCASEPLNNVPLQWRPTADTNLHLQRAQVGDTRVQFESFRVTSRQPGLIAEDRESSAPKPVTTSDDVGVFVSKEVRHLFDANGIDTFDADGDIVISGEVRQFFAEETSTYSGKVELHLTVRNRAGEVLWSGTTSGSANRLGLPYSLENYYKVLSDALIHATWSLLQDYGFLRALGQKPAG